jgi:hypothetical protein
MDAYRRQRQGWKDRIDPKQAWPALSGRANSQCRSNCPASGCGEIELVPVERVPLLDGVSQCRCVVPDASIARHDDYELRRLRQ